MFVCFMLMGWEVWFGYFMSFDFFDVSEDEMVFFVFIGIEVIGVDFVLIIGDLILNDVIKFVVLDVKLN